MTILNSTRSNSQQEVEKDNSVIASLCEKIDADILAADYSDVVEKMGQLSVKAKEDMLALCITALEGRQSKKSRQARIAAVRAIVALLPLSLGAITSLLSQCQSKYQYEVHYTLFCYLDWAQEIPANSAVAREVLLVVEKYLMTVPCTTARAAWMAGDMLGGHWNEQESMPVLIKAAQTARYSAGRQSGLLGLEKMLGRLSGNETARADMLEAIAKVSLSDRSKSLKREATALLDCGRRRN